jgi:Fe-S-cluster-containing dehydrogenase component/anaerobic selenocysteine-containing dehydrogenase
MKKDWGTNEFLTEGLSDWDPTLDRREFLRLSSAAIALAGLSACVKPPVEKMFSYVSQPEDMVLGEPLFFATHFCLGGLANGLLVETHEGRPTRIDGNPKHPANLGKASAIHQALALSIYDPDRLTQVVHARLPSTASEFQIAFREQIATLEKNGGEGFAILSGVTSSDTLIEQRNALVRKFPKMMWVEYDALVSGNREAAAKEVFGEALSPVYDFKSASVVVSIDSDFLSHPHSPLVYAKDFADQPNLKLFAIESSASLTGAKAKHRLALKPSRLKLFCETLGHELLQGENSNLYAETPLDEHDFLQSLIRIVKKSTGSVLFIAGDQQSIKMHSLCHLLNARFGKGAVRFVRTPERTKHFGLAGIQELTSLMNARKINTLLMLGGNPAYAMPGGLDFKSALKKVTFKAHLTLEANETSAESQWLIPEAHPLECFTDARAFEGTLSFSQPMIAPLYDGLTASELLHWVLTGETKSGLEILASHYRKKWGVHFDERFKEALRQGFVSETPENKKAPLAKISFSNLLPLFHAHGPESTDQKIVETMEVSFREDRKIYDGRFANHPWLQEFSDPLTRLTWGNAALFHPETLKARNLSDGDVVEISTGSQKVLAPVFSDPLQPRDSATIQFGYGRTEIGSTGKNMGFSAYPIWNGDASAFLTIRSTGQKEELACTQGHHSMEGRDLIRKVAPTEIASHAETTSLYDKIPITDGEYAWAMTIDLDRCTGCGACVLACQSENNIPVVGKSGVKIGREMHWIRVDRYFEEASIGAQTQTSFQPVPCMHCEKAPCEPVCPTGATLHGDGGLNQMVYNRCVGTRYCSNNCPYKVRRFNFLTYNDKTSKLAARSRNPDVTVRTRGVMEKCTYCVQRISAARIESARTKTSIKDGGVKTACQTTCPSSAIEFGNIHDPNSRVSLKRQSHRNYGLLEELGTRPRTTYLAKLVNEEDA